MNHSEFTRELDFCAARETWDATGRRHLVPDRIDFAAFVARPAVLLEHRWRSEVGRVTALRLDQGVLSGTMQILARGINHELDELGAALLMGSAGLSVGLLRKPGGPAGAAWLEEISLVRTPGCARALITAINSLDDWRP
jgi:hypothetical protein